MPKKMIEFELLSGERDADGDQMYCYVELEVDWHFEYDPGKTTGRYEDCYPPSESSDLYVENIEQILANMNSTTAPENLQLVYAALEKCDVAQWAIDEAQSRAEDRADFLYEQEKDRRLGL